MMFVVREFIQSCGERAKTPVGEISFATRREAEHALTLQYRELLANQEKWPGVWSKSLNANRYTLDNNDGDFFEGEICKKVKDDNV